MSYQKLQDDSNQQPQQTQQPQYNQQSYQQHSYQQQVYVQQQPVQTAQPVYQHNSVEKEDTNTALIFFVLGFFCAPIWIICYCKFKTYADSTIHTLAVISLVLFIISMTFVAISIGILVVYFIFLILAALFFGPMD